VELARRALAPKGGIAAAHAGGLIYSSRGRPGSKGTALAQIEDGRTMGSTDPELPRPAAAAEQICNFARTILDPYVQKGQP
jgi:hypothetical protein